jgi:hypothetical protein
MRNLIKGALFFALVGTVMIGCEKDESISPVDSNDNDNIEASKTKSLPNNKAHGRVYYDNGGNDYGCSGSGGNCLDDVIVEAALGPAMEDIIIVVNTNNQPAIQEEFSDNAFVESVVPVDVINGVISNNLVVTLKSNSDYDYLLFHNIDSQELESAIPIIK